MNERRYQVTLERNGKRAVIILRADEARDAARFGCMKWGSGPKWTVLQVEKVNY